MADHRSCSICCEELTTASSVHARCSKSLYGSNRVPKIEVDPSQFHLLGLEMAGRTTLSGVQRKVALGWDHGVLRVSAAPMRYILKPSEDRFPNLPENEHVCMLLARLAGFDVPPVGLIRLLDDSLGLIVKRFDRTDAGAKLALEDFCQLGQRLPSQKYDSSSEFCVDLVKRYSSASPLDLKELFRLLLFSWWIGNGDLHLKNISLLTQDPGKPRLSPVYDLVNTTLVIPDDQLALPIAGKRANLRVRDWLSLAERCELPAAVVVDVSRQLALITKPALGLLDRSFLPAESKTAFARQLVDRASVLVELAKTAATDSKKHSKLSWPRVVTGEAAGRLGLALESQLARIGVPLAGSYLESELEDLNWLARFPGDIFGPGGAIQEDPAQTVESFQKTIRLERLIRCVRRAAKLDGVDRVAKHLKQLSGTSPGDNERAQQASDHLFQLEVGALLDSKHMRVEFEAGSTDVVLVDAYKDRLGVECKRPRKQDTLLRNVRKGIQQLRKANLSGFVAVSLDSILDCDAGTPRRAEVNDKLIQQVIKNCKSELLELLVELGTPEEDSVILGVLFCSTQLAVQKVDETNHAISKRFQVSAIANPALPNAEKFLEFPRNLMIAGDRELWLDDGVK